MVNRRRHISKIAQLAAVALTMLLVTGCATGAPSVYRSTPTPGGDGSIDAPIVDPATPTGGDDRAGLSALETSDPTATPPPSPTATAEPSPSPTAIPTETPRPDPPAPSVAGVSEAIWQGSSGRREIALTFDAGDDRGYAEDILDTLAAYGALATFGITGHWAHANPDLVRRMVEEGHQVINHTWSHGSFTGYSSGGAGVTGFDARQSELEETNDVIMREGGGYDTRPYWRPPYGDLDDGVLRDLAALGYTLTIMWSCDSLGWNGLTADEINARCTDTAEPGDIILMHVGAASQDAAALPTMIERLRTAGFTFVTIEQMLQD